MGFRTPTVRLDGSGNVVRRLRCCSEGEEMMAVSLPTQGPLPDLVPVTQACRERSQSAPDVELLQRQRERAVGREFRRIADEFDRNHDTRRGGNGLPNGALAVLHAELNGVAVYVVTGVRRLLYADLPACLAHLVHWTRRALDPSHHHQGRHPADTGSPVDQAR